jgi:hypothetical protein
MSSQHHCLYMADDEGLTSLAPEDEESLEALPESSAITVLCKSLFPPDSTRATVTDEYALSSGLFMA